VRLRPRIPGTEAIQIGFVKRLKLQDLPRGTAGGEYLTPKARESPSEARIVKFPNAALEADGERKIPGYRMKRNSQKLHDPCDGDDARSADEGARSDHRSSDQTRPRD